jgi:NAD(P)H-hydrate epimerase
MLKSNRYEPVVCYIEFTEKTTEDWKTNLLRLNKESNVEIVYVKGTDQIPVISNSDVIIDAIFGTGLTRPAGGLAGDVIRFINLSRAAIISVDIPSGLFGEDNSSNNYETIISADFTLSFQFPKLSFMFAENAPYLGEWIILPIGLNQNAVRNTLSPFVFLEKNDVAGILRKRNKFDHKGIFGHGLLVSGSYGKMGAAVIGAEAALRTGIGLITCHVPYCGVAVLQPSIPEAMVISDQNEKHISQVGTTDSYSAVGAGPGIGTEPETQRAIHDLLKECKKPMVIDADGLNILSLNPTWLAFLPEGTILTPHPKEFERLAGKSADSYQRLTKQIEFAKDHRCIVILKGANTSVATPDGRVFFNSTGNPGMAKAGSGDALTGIILSLLSQGYKPEEAAILGVYIHGLAGDIAVVESSYESIIATDIINNISKAFNKLREGQ